MGGAMRGAGGEAALPQQRRRGAPFRRSRRGGRGAGRRGRRQGGPGGRRGLPGWGFGLRGERGRRLLRTRGGILAHYEWERRDEKLPGRAVRQCGGTMRSSAPKEARSWGMTSGSRSLMQTMSPASGLIPSVPSRVGRGRTRRSHESFEQTGAPAARIGPPRGRTVGRCTKRGTPLHSRLRNGIIQQHSPRLISRICLGPPHNRAHRRLAQTALQPGSRPPRPPNRHRSQDRRPRSMRAPRWRQAAPAPPQ